MTRRASIDDLTAIAVPEQPALSPDGSLIVYALRTSDVIDDRNVRSLWCVAAASGEPWRLTWGPSDFAPSWSPDGTRIAFLRAQNGPPQIWVLPARGGEADQLTRLPLGAGEPRWSPDGSRIVFSAPVDLHATVGEDRAARERRFDAPIVVDRLDFKADGSGLRRTVRQHVHVVDVRTTEVARLTDGDWHARGPAWSPDSSKLAFVAATSADVDLSSRAAAYVLDIPGMPGSIAEPERVGFAVGYPETVAWTADGDALLVVGSLESPIGPAGLWRVPLSSAEPIVDLTASLDRNVMPGGPAYPGALPQLTADGSTVVFCVRDAGCTHLYSASVAGAAGSSAPRPVVAGPGRIVVGMSAAANCVVVVLTTPTSFGELAVVDVVTGAVTVRTDYGSALAEVEWFIREDQKFAISDGTTVHGWLVRDPAAVGPQPLLVDIHGGPHNAWNGSADEVHLYHQVLVAAGWTVLLLNPRASDGYGKTFFTATTGDWGAADANDFLEPIDALVAARVADPARLAVTGYSYGGFMTCYLTSRDNRFAAAVAGGLIADIGSMVGTSDLGHHISEYELAGQPWTGRGPYDAISPLTRVADVQTPTLILHGADDLRCPVGQAELWFTALRERQIPTQLVLYPKGSHVFVIEGPPSHRTDYNRRVVDWVRRYAGGRESGRPLAIDASHWQGRLSALAERHHVPGATLGILQVSLDGDDDVVEAAHGVLNRETGVAVTADSLFQMGSISKVWTTTLVMQLVDEGLLDLDAPVIDVLPELRLSDPEVTKQLTMRHLLTHTSGIDGDVFTDTGRGDECVARYVEALDAVAQNYPLGVTFSYCNSGFVLAGRVIEKLTGTTWDEALRSRLLVPLRLQHTVTLPEDAMLHRVAVGHSAGSDPVRVDTLLLPRSVGPAGTITSTVADLLAFARMHVNGGVAADGTRILSATGVAEMQALQTELPDSRGLRQSWGLGWIRGTWAGRQVIGHDGSTVGQNAFFWMLPDSGLAVALFTNGGNPGELFADLFREIFAEVAGVEMPAPLMPPDVPPAADITPHLGIYERAGVRLEITDGANGWTLRSEVTGPLAAVLPTPIEERRLRADGQDSYLAEDPQTNTWLPLAFYELSSGQRCVHYGLRATPLVSSVPPATHSDNAK